jgi:hypothetical protein
MGSLVGAIEGGPPTMSRCRCRGVLRGDPYATQDHKLWWWGSRCLWAWTGSPCMKPIFLCHEVKKDKENYIIVICSVLLTLIYSKYALSADYVMSGQKKLYKASFMHAARASQIIRGKTTRERETSTNIYLQMAFNFIIGQTVNLHEFPDLFWGGHCFHASVPEKKSGKYQRQ